MYSKNIPLSQLIASPANVRKTTSKEGIEELKHSILAHGIMQNLIVVACDDKYQVIAGSRRLQALQELAKNNHLANDYSVPCQVTDANNSEELSLAENVMREAMHPADEYEAFASLVGKSTIAEIAIRFGKSQKYVEQRLLLGKVAPEIMKDFRANKIDLKCMMAFTICPDQKKQVSVYKSLKAHDRNSYQIRQKLTEKMYPADSGLAVFVGKDAYKNAGGTFQADLFATNDSIFFTDGALLKKLADEKAERAAEKFKSEGWGFVEYGGDNAGYEFIRTYETVFKIPKKSDLPKHGLYFYINYDGKLNKTMLKSKDTAKPAKQNKGVSQALHDDLAAYRMEVLQAFVASNFNTAYDILAYSAALSLCDDVYHSDHFSEIHFKNAMSSKNVVNEETPAKRELRILRDKLNFSWNKGTDSQKLENFMQLNLEDRARFMAYAFALTIKGRIDEKPSAYTLAGQYLNADVAGLWRPTYENYFRRVDQATIDKIGKELFQGAWKSAKNKSKDAKFIAQAIANPENAAKGDLALQERLEGWLPKGMTFSALSELPNEKSKASVRGEGGKFVKKAS